MQSKSWGKNWAFECQYIVHLNTPKLNLFPLPKETEIHLQGEEEINVACKYMDRYYIVKNARSIFQGDLRLSCGASLRNRYIMISSVPCKEIFKVTLKKKHE
jgi:hypothetical protein